MKEKKLIREIQKGKKEYLNEIAQQYYDDIYRFCCYQTGNQEEAYDLTQETFLRFIRYIESYQEKNLKGYLLTIAMNLCREYFKKQKNCEEEVEISSLENKKSHFDSKKEITLTLISVIKKLPFTQREVILLHYCYGFKYTEIAKMTGTNLSTVKSRMKQGIEKLKMMLRKEDFYE